MMREPAPECEPAVCPLQMNGRCEWPETREFSNKFADLIGEAFAQ